MKWCRSFVLAIALFVMAACTSTPPVSIQPDLTFDHITPLAVDVADLDIKDEYAPPLSTPHVEHMFPTPLYTAAADLLRHSVTTGGRAHQLRFIIEEASVTEGTIQDNENNSVLGGDIFNEYSGRISVRIEVVSSLQPDQILGRGYLVVTRNTRVSQTASPARREATWFVMTEKMLADLNAGIHQVLNQKLSQFLL